MAPKYFSLVLHSHIPFVLAHGSWPHGMDWLYEAAAETYLPLLDAFERLAKKGLPPKVNIGFTPVLMAQLKDPGFVEGFSAYLRMKVAIARDDEVSFARAGRTDLQPLAAYWRAWYEERLAQFLEGTRGDIIGAFRALQDGGQLEVLTSAATHGYFPLLSRDSSIRHQVRQGKETYRRYFDRDPRGFWIPECAYRPGYAWQPPFGGGEARPRQGVDEILGAEGLGYFFVDSHLLKGGEAKGVYLERFPGLKLLWDNSRQEMPAATEFRRDLYQPYFAYPSNVPFFARDDVSGVQVWSRNIGYPGDGAYLEFHKKHFPGGMRYWRITSSDADLALKAPYEPAKAKERLEAHAAHFVSVLTNALQGRETGLITSLYDTELFGHWWFEGPEWLGLLLEKLAASEVRPITAGESLEKVPPQTIVSLPEGSWGQGGFHFVWLNEDTAWIWEKIYRIEEAAERLARRPSSDRRLRQQFFREKFLLESSDWPFLISTWTARDYAENRAAEHYERAARLAAWIERGTPLSPEEEVLLRVYEQEDRLFDEVVEPDGRAD